MTKFATLKDYNGYNVVFTKYASRVELHSKKYTPEQVNPIIGSIYECTGTVSNLFIGSRYQIEVIWDNGYRNKYKSNDLVKIGDKPLPPKSEDINEANPNREFRLRRRKQSRFEKSQDQPVKWKSWKEWMEKETSKHPKSEPCELLEKKNKLQDAF